MNQNLLRLLSVTSDCVMRTGRPPERCIRQASRERGIAMLLVLVVVAMATVLGTAFMAAQSTTTGITRNLEDQAVARQIAESGLLLMRNKIQSDDAWRTGRKQGTWVSEQKMGQGTFTVDITDDDGDPSNNTDDPFVLTVTGRYGSVTHVVRSRVMPYVSEGAAGLKVDYFHSSSALSKLSNIDWKGTPNFTEVQPNVERVNSTTALAYEGGPLNKWGARYGGFITLPSSGLWTFYTASDDGSNLSIDGNVVVNNDNNHSWQTKSGSKTLDAGTYPFEVLFYENGGSHGVIAYWQGPGVSKDIIPASAFSRAGSSDVDAPVGTSPEDVAVAMKNVVQMFGYSHIDSYKSTMGVYGGANKTGNARVSTNGILTQLGVTMSDNAVIDGKILVRPLLPILPVIRWGNSKITDGVAYLPAAMDIADVSAPTPLPKLASPASMGIWSASDNPPAVTQDIRYSSISMGGNSQLTIQGNVTIVCQGDFQIGSTASIVISPGSSLKLYVSGSFNVYESAVINAANNDPGRLEIFMYGNNKSVQLDGSSKTSGYIYNPKGGLKMYSTAEFFGKYFGETLTMSGSPQLHADNSAIGEKSDTATAGTTYVFAWDEGF